MSKLTENETKKNAKSILIIVIILAIIGGILEVCS